MKAAKAYPNIYAQLHTFDLVKGIAVQVALASASGDPSPISSCFMPYYTVAVQGDEWLMCDADLSNPTNTFQEVEAIAGCKLKKRMGATLRELAFDSKEATSFLASLEASLSS